jgi:hypothetical protein
MAEGYQAATPREPSGRDACGGSPTRIEAESRSRPLECREAACRPAARGADPFREAAGATWYENVRKRAEFPELRALQRC